jgi:hypothetical protein
MGMRAIVLKNHITSSDAEIDRMMRKNPAVLLGLQP